MRVGDIVRIVNLVLGPSQSVGYLVDRVGRIVAGSAKRSQPVFWLVELDEKKPTAIQRLGGWSGIAISGSHLRVIG